jgi:hypothetical protein
MTVLGEKLGDGPADHSTGLGVVPGALFLRSSRVCPTLLVACKKVATYEDHPQEAYVGRTWSGVGSVRVVLVGFSPAGCTSIRIIVTLGYE